MKAQAKAKWTSGVRTQVARRKRAAFITAMAKMAGAAVDAAPRSILFADYLTPWQMGFFIREARAEGITCAEWVNNLLVRAMGSAREEQPPAA